MVETLLSVPEAETLLGDYGERRKQKREYLLVVTVVGRNVNNGKPAVGKKNLCCLRLHSQNLQTLVVCAEILAKICHKSTCFRIRCHKDGNVWVAVGIPVPDNANNSVTGKARTVHVH